MSLGKLCALFFVLIFTGVQARADVTILLEEPYSYDGALAGTGHAAVYLTRICAASPTLLRSCDPGEFGAVISRYNRVAGRDWIAIPLIPYLYAVARPENVPLYADSKLVSFLRNQYRRQYLREIAPDGPSGEIPDGDWIQLVGSAYDRSTYGFQIESTAEQDEALIRHLNSLPNRASYKLISRNCADFVREIVNFYYPGAVSRNIVADLGIMTPKQVSKSLVKFSRHHPELDFISFIIPQVPGSNRRSKPVRGLVESVFKAKKYVVPLAVFQPFVAAGFGAAYLLGGRFDPGRHALVFNPHGILESPLTAGERNSYRERLDRLTQANPQWDSGGRGTPWQQFQEKAEYRLDISGYPILQAPFDGEVIAMGISRDTILNTHVPVELQRDFLMMRLREEISAGGTPKTSGRELRNDWRLLQEVISTEQEGVAANADFEHPEPPGSPN
jgi:hypothetical protein